MAMRSAWPHNLLVRLLAVVLTAATVLVAPVASLAAAEHCRSCRDCDACPSNGAAEHLDGDCCSVDGSAATLSTGGSGDGGSPRDADCCPPGCTRCCLTQGRAPVPAAQVVAIRPDALARDACPAPAPAPLPGGVHESIFHPPRA